MRCVWSSRWMHTKVQDCPIGKQHGPNVPSHLTTPGPSSLFRINLGTRVKVIDGQAELRRNPTQIYNSQENRFTRKEMGRTPLRRPPGMSWGDHHLTYRQPVSTSSYSLLYYHFLPKQEIIEHTTPQRAVALRRILSFNLSIGHERRQCWKVSIYTSCKVGPQGI